MLSPIGDAVYRDYALDVGWAIEVLHPLATAYGRFAIFSSREVQRASLALGFLSSVD